MPKRYFKCPYCGDDNEKTDITIDDERKNPVHAFVCNGCKQTFEENFVQFYSDVELNMLAKKHGALPSPISKVG